LCKFTIQSNSEKSVKISQSYERIREGHSVERMYLRQRCSDGSVNKTILKPRLAAAAGREYVYVGFSRRKSLRSTVYTISEKAIRFRHPDYNPDRAQKLISSSMSRHLSTRNISSKSIHAFLSHFANRQTDRQTNTAKNIYLLLCHFYGSRCILHYLKNCKTNQNKNLARHRDHENVSPDTPDTPDMK